MFWIRVVGTLRVLRKLVKKSQSENSTFDNNQLFTLNNKLFSKQILLKLLKLCILNLRVPVKRAKLPCTYTDMVQEKNYICTSLCTISSFVMRWVVRFKSCIRALRLWDHSFRISLDSLWALKLTMPAGRSILANTVLDTTSSERNNSVSW